MTATTTNYSYDFYLRNIYSSNRFARKAGNRETMLPRDLVKADSSALDKISTQLRNLEISSDNGTEVLQSAKLFVQTYNNALESTNQADSEQITRLRKEMKNLTKDQKDALEAIGITVSSSGKLTLDKSEFAESSPSKIKSVFGKDSTFTSSLCSVAKKIKRTIQRTTPPTQGTKKKSSSPTTDDTVGNTLPNDTNPASVIDVLL